jgi:N-terminal domain of anti-restriction factor ArdC
MCGTLPGGGDGNHRPPPVGTPVYGKGNNRPSPGLYQVEPFTTVVRVKGENNQMTTKRKSAKTTQERRAMVTDLRDRLAAFQGDLDEARLAELTARFDGYSPRNALLIAMQSPEATDVSGFKAWIARDRSVKPGESGIQILAPAGRKDAVEATEETDAQPERQFFRVAYVFDVAQTEPLEVAQARWAAKAAERAAAVAA